MRALSREVQGLEEDVRLWDKLAQQAWAVMQALSRLIVLRVSIFCCNELTPGIVAVSILFGKSAY